MYGFFLVGAWLVGERVVRGRRGPFVRFPVADPAVCPAVTQQPSDRMVGFFSFVWEGGGRGDAVVRQSRRLGSGIF